MSFNSYWDVKWRTTSPSLYFLNVVNEHLRDILAQDQRTREAPPGENSATQRSRYRREDVKPRQAHCLPLVDNLLKDNTDGCALAALLHFYCPTSVKLEDVCLKETMSLADSLYNLQLVQDFCSENLNHCCHFSLEDMLYASSSIKSNYLVFMAELFWWFEVVKPSFVQPRSFDAKVPEPTRSSAKMAPISKNKPSFLERSCSPEQSSSQPNTNSSSLIKRSSSMSYVDGCVGTWPKEKRSSAHGISFEIPFDDEVTPVQPGSSGRGMARSASTEGLGFKVHHANRNMRRNLSFQPINGQEGYIQEEDSDEFAEASRRAGRARTRSDAKYSNGLLPEDHSQPLPSTPSIEEALKIIHDSERSHSSLPTSSGGNSFFLHGREMGDPADNVHHDNDNDEPGDIGCTARADDGDLNSTSTEVDTGIHVRTEDIQDGQDEDSSLKDYSDMDQDYEVRSCPLPDSSSSPCTSLMGVRSLGCGSPASSSGSGGVRMTSFAEQKFRKRNQAEGRNSGSGSNTPESSELNLPNATAAAAAALPAAVGRAVTPETRSPAHLTSPRDPSHILASEMVHLKMKLEEKRRAIEAQKKKVEAAFTRHRQRMGRTAFLNVVRRKGGSMSPSPVADTASSPNFGKPPSPSPVADLSTAQTPTPGSAGDGAGLERCKPDGAAPKSPVEDGGAEVDLAEYTRTIERLNTSLSFLQSEMQRLARQQESIMQMRDKQAWVISPPSHPQPSPQKQLRELRSSSVTGRGGSVGSLSPILSSSATGGGGGTGSPRTTHRSPSTIKRKSASFHARTPRTPRPSELKITPFSRMLNTPQSVDSLPRLRRFSPSTTQTACFAYLGHDSRPSAEAAPGSGEQETKDRGQAPDQAKDKPQRADTQSEKSQGAQAEEKTTREKGESRDRGGGEERGEGGKKATSNSSRPGSVAEMMSQPVSEAFVTTKTTTSLTSAKDLQAQSRKDLIEVPLSVLKPEEGQESGLESGPDGEPGLENRDQKMCCGFFYRDDLQGEEDIAQKRAALLEKRQRREREMQQKKQQLEAELEQKKEAARLKAEEERQKREDDKARRDYIKNEYLRRKQLKLMEDMDSVIKPRPASIKKKPRPKSMHRDIMESPKPPIKTTGSRPRGYSVSSLSLASLNLADNESVQSDKRTPRPDSAEGYLSPCQSVSRNGENWENESTTSSVASNTEYTGPKLYKEPSAKSNKYIIQNALAHCCLAGKVNEGQKNKILEEMEKTESNNFLILFRDSGCQFRSLYTYCPETEEITRLTGIGPKTITLKMIESLFKYNSDKKQFSHIPAKTMSANVDAITIYGHLWQTKKQGTPKKFQPLKS
ncbi:hypothetical protein ACEWY4_006276 [Coilia grayii]|uniref:Calmodulin-regulated spectrin-associated protein 2-like n=1 Tax=Coilia grayii TaxID=363190 RepID=A0ABD1KDB6_9TELE